MSRYGAVDIGSNSVRMQAAEVGPGDTIEILAEDRQVTRLGERVFQSGKIRSEAIESTADALRRMAATLNELQVGRIRAVATSAVRDARNQKETIERASEAIGAEVEVISGQEEARLIHLGVQSRWPHPKQDILVIDIGGGSAELMRGSRGHLAGGFSKPLGAVRLAETFLKDDPPTPQQLHRLDEYIEQKIAPVLSRIGGERPARTIATAATASAVVCAVHRVPRARRDLVDRLRISRKQLVELYEMMSRRSLAERREVPGIGPRRAEVIVAGLAVLRRVLTDFGLPSFYYSAAGVRDGLISDMAQDGAESRADALDEERREVVRSMARRYGVPLKHVDRVASLAGRLFHALRPVHGLPASAGRSLEAAAYLYDIGHFVSDTRHHRHTYYLVANSDISGFSNRERLVIANLCRYHRKALPSEEHENFRALSRDERKTVMQLIPLLRLADSLDRSREQRVVDVQVRIRKSKVELYLQSSKDVDLEQWAAQQVEGPFEQVYGATLAVLQSA